MACNVQLNNTEEWYYLTGFHNSGCESRVLSSIYDKGNDMQTTEEDNDRRVDDRIELPLQITLYDQSGKAMNISATGVYFEVITEDIDAFAPGATIPIRIAADTSTPGNGEGRIKLNGIGTVIRSKIINVTSHGNEIGVAVQFNEHLNVSDVSMQ